MREGAPQLRFPGGQSPRQRLTADAWEVQSQGSKDKPVRQRRMGSHAKDRITVPTAVSHEPPRDPARRSAGISLWPHGTSLHRLSREFLPQSTPPGRGKKKKVSSWLGPAFWFPFVEFHYVGSQLPHLSMSSGAFFFFNIYLLFSLFALGLSCSTRDLLVAARGFLVVACGIWFPDER